MTNKLTTLPEIKSIIDIVRHSKELPTIRNSEPDEVNGAILDLVIKVFAFYNESPTDIQLPLLLKEVKDSLLGLTLHDIAIFKKNCLQGQYPLKFRLLPNVFIDWIKEYKADRMEAFQIFNSGAKLTEYEPLTERSKEIINEILEMTKPKPIYSTDQPKESREQNQAKRLQIFIEKEFNKLWEDQGEPSEENGNSGYTLHYINYSNPPYFKKTWSKHEYIKIRFEEIILEYGTEWTNSDQAFKQLISQSEHIYKEIEIFIK